MDILGPIKGVLITSEWHLDILCNQISSAAKFSFKYSSASILLLCALALIENIEEI